MTIFKRPNGKWVVQVYDPAIRRSRQVGTFANRKDAKRAEAEAIDRSTATGRETVRSFHDRWLRDFPRPRESTMVTYRERTKSFVAEHGRRRIDSITVQEARQWCVAHRHDVGALRAMFGDARKLGLVVTNPFAALGLPKGKGRRNLPDEWLTTADVDRLAETARKAHGAYGPMMASMVRFAAYSGLRPGELFALEFGDLDGTSIHVRRAADSKTRTITPPKNGRARTIVFVGHARTAVDEAPRFEGQETVFVAPRGGRLWLPHFNWLWNPVRAAFGRPTMHFYELRHFCATYLLELGLSPSDVAVQLGHTDNGKLVMDVYGHPSERAARARILAAVDGHAEHAIQPVRADRKAG